MKKQPVYGGLASGDVFRGLLGKEIVFPIFPNAED